MKHSGLKHVQRGLSLLMMLVIIAIIGILAEVALLAYQDYVAQEQVIKK